MTKGALLVPPTYFAVAHADRMPGVHTEVFTLVAQVSDPTVRVRIHEAVPRLGQSFRRREVVMPAFMPVMTRQVRRFAPDVVHQHFATWSFPAVAAARGSSPLLTTLHGVDAFIGATKPRGAMGRWHAHNVELARRHSARVLAVSEYLAGVATSSGFDPDRLAVHYQGVDTDWFCPAPADAAGAGDDQLPTALFVGALLDQKGVRDVLEASRRVHDQGLPHRLLVVGSGPLRPVVDDFASTRPWVQVLGSLDRSRVREVMRTADVLVMASQAVGRRREAAGLVALEAQACGTPVAAYRSGGVPEMVADTTRDRLAGEQDVAALSEAVRSLLAVQGTERAALRARTRDWVVAHRSLATSAQELEAHYRDLAEGGVGAPAG